MKKKPPARFKVLTGAPKMNGVYYVYAADLTAAMATFRSAMPEFGYNFSVWVDHEEWTTSLFEGRIAPGA